MIKRLICAIAFPLATIPSAYAETWQFSYQGFYLSDAGFFDPYSDLTGKFSGTDADGDGTVEFHELTHFELNAMTYGIGTANYCAPGEYCKLESFEYQLTGQLDFSTWGSFSDENGSFQTRTIVAGDKMHFSSTRSDGSTNSWSRIWTEQTQFQITPPPIPEPSTYAMLIAGLMLLAARRTAPQHQPVAAPRLAGSARAAYFASTPRV